MDLPYRGAAVGLVLLLVVASLQVWGENIFSPGELRALPGERIGGVTSHAALGHRCGACHLTPADPRGMTEHCLSCHTATATELRDSTSLHGALEGSECAQCHGEHRGASAALTSLQGMPDGFDHGATGFALDGAHRGVACRSCHERAGGLRFGGTAAECRACHAEDDVHRGEFGGGCQQCHGSSSWQAVTFTHTFPVRHGRRGASDCARCHAGAPASFATYTCYGCHEHSPAQVRAEHLEEGIRDWRNCARCHPRGED